MRLAEFVRCGKWEALEQHGFDVGIPSRIDNGFVREDRVGRAAAWPRENQDEGANR
jgi:hypothetical protein